ncbi:MAG: class I SAM-dependent methyltransferase [Pseudomonadales bacterium]|nr:class I SAM-dependent methyltransferase [Pseudomonadales bacterium]
MTKYPAEYFHRQDESADENFYRLPRFVRHIDDATIANLSAYYKEVLPAKGRILDLMSSWVSHLPVKNEFVQVSGLGMNAEELAANTQLNDFQTQNLNVTPQLPYENASFDAVLIAVSVQYLNQPMLVFDDIKRCLKGNGLCIVAISHRLFPTKAIQAFHVLSLAARCELVASYMQQAGFDQVQIIDRSPVEADPLWLIVGSASG